MKFKVINDERTPVERKLRIRIDPESVQEAWNQEVRKLARETTVQGFRKGKAPHHLVERHIGRDTIWERVRDETARMALSEILVDAEPAPIAPPRIEFDDTPLNKSENGPDDDNGDKEIHVWESGEALEFTAICLLPPPSPEEIERDLIRGAGLERPGADTPEPGIEAPMPPSIAPPDPRSEIPGSGTQNEASD